MGSTIAAAAALLLTASALVLAGAPPATPSGVGSPVAASAAATGAVTLTGTSFDAAPGKGADPADTTALGVELWPVPRRAALRRPAVSAPHVGPAPAEAPGLGSDRLLAGGVGSGPHQVTYGWPTGARGEVVRPFERPVAEWASGHRGVDLRLEPGAPVLAAGSGVVAFAGRVAGRSVVSVDHADGIRTTYEPVVPAVARGDAVSAGALIGWLDSAGSHCEPASCLHWGARRAHDYLDPAGLVRSEVVIRLYPVG